MTQPRAAVVVPCYNDGPFIADAVASVSEQEPCELVVVDDGSTDVETLRVLAGLERSGVRVLHQENRGLAAARMSGVAATSARYVQPLDADDRLPKDVVTTMADALDGNAGAQAAWGDVRTFGASDWHVPQRPDIDPWRIAYLNELPATPMVRREALLEVGGWDLGSVPTREPEMDSYSDWDLWMKAAERGWHGIHVSRVTVLYREHSHPRMYEESLKRHDKLRERLRSRHPWIFHNRRRAWRRSRSAWPIKVLFPVVEMVPRLNELRKEKLWLLIRHIFEPQMSPDFFPRGSGLVLLYLRKRVALLSPAARVRGGSRST